MKPGRSRNLVAGLLLAAGLAVRLVAAEGDAELEKFAEGVLKFDVNGDGKFDDAERAAAAPHYSPILLSYFTFLFEQHWADADGDGRVTLNDFRMIQRGWQPEDICRRILVASDRNGDGRLDRQESLNRREITPYCDYNPSDPKSFVRRFFGVQGRAPEYPDTISQMADRDGNGYVDLIEHRRAEILLERLLTSDKNSRKGIVEKWMAGSEETHFQDALVRLCPEANQDNDSWLSAAELETALAKVLPVYDADQNGVLDWVERGMVIRDGQCAWPRNVLVSRLARSLDLSGNSGSASSAGGREEKILAEAVKRYGAPGSTGFGLAEIYHWRRQVENGEILAMQEALVDWLRPRLETQMNPGWGGEARLALWKKRFALYDTNHDGKLDGLECSRFLQGDFLPGNANMYWYTSSCPSDISSWQVFAETLAGGRDPTLSSADRQALLPLWFIKVDLDHDGIFSPADVQALQPLLEEPRRKIAARHAIERVLQASYDIYSGNQVEAELAKWRQRLDLDRDGRFNADELRALEAETDAVVRDQVLSLCREKFSRFAGFEAYGKLNVHDQQLINAMLRLFYDQDRSGTFEKDEIAQMVSSLNQLRYQEREAQRRQEEDRKLLAQYDLDGDGRISPAERARAAADLARKERDKVIAPPQDE